jgi:hypothetical protein
MNSASRSRAPFSLALGFGFALALALGAAAVGCGPKEKFCTDTDDGVCTKPVDAGQQSDAVDAPEMDMGSVFIGQDANNNNDASNDN